MKMNDKANNAILKALHEAKLDASIDSRTQRSTRYEIRVDDVLPVTLEFKNTTGRKRTVKQAQKDWEANKYALYAQRLRDVQAEKYYFQLDEAFEKDGYRSSYEADPTRIIGQMVEDSGWISMRMMITVPESYFADCEDFVAMGGVRA